MKGAIRVFADNRRHGAVRRPQWARTQRGHQTGAVAGMLSRMELMVEDETPDPTVREIGQRLFALGEQLRVHFERVTATYELTFTQAVALHFLDEPVPMGRLAELLHCERSNVTLIVDRLTDRGVVERQADPTDRRVRRLVLTREGKALREQLREHLFRRVPAVVDLDEDERATLLQLLRKLTPDDAGATLERQ